jgi:[acyl-carrier-protein] S-malonyltransferase
MYEAGTSRPGTMAAILGLEGAVVEALCAEVDAGVVCAANLNSPGQVVVSGEPAGVEAAMALATERGAKKVVPLKVSGAFHSPLMEPAARGLAETLADVEIRPAAIPVLANASAKAVTEPEAIRTSLVDQLTSAVRWEDIQRSLLADPGPPFVEPGPGRVLRGLLRSLDRRAEAHGAGTPDEIEAAIEGGRG